MQKTTEIYIEKDINEMFGGYFVKKNDMCIGYAYTKWGAKLIAKRYRKGISKEYI